MKTSLFGSNAERVMVLLVAGMVSGLFAAEALAVAANAMVEKRDAHEPFLHVSMPAGLSVECIMPEDVATPLKASCSLQIG